MECRFEGAFTEEEKRRIRASLEALDEVARSRGIESEGNWRVEQQGREAGEEGDVEFHAVHDDSGVEFWGDTCDDLARSIDKTAAFLSKRR